MARRFRDNNGNAFGRSIYFVSKVCQRDVERRRVRSEEACGECPMPIDFDDDSMQSSTHVGREARRRTQAECVGRLRGAGLGGGQDQPK